MCPKDLKRTTGETIVIPWTYSDNMYTPYEPGRITERSDNSIGISITMFQGSSPSSSSLQHCILPSDDLPYVEHMLPYSMMIQKQPEIRKGVSAGST